MTTQVPASMVAADVATQAELDLKADKAGVQFTGWAATTPVVVAFSATAMVVNCALSNVFTIAMTANVNRNPKKRRRPFGVQEFVPSDLRREFRMIPGIRMTKSTLHALKPLFAKEGE